MNEDTNNYQEKEISNEDVQKLIEAVEKLGYSVNSNSEKNYDYDYYEIERKIIEDVTRIKANADQYGEVVDVVGRRAILTRGSNGRGNGYAYEYKLSDGRVVSNDYAWELANAGKLRNIVGSHNKGRKYIRSVGDGITSNSLSRLPRF